VTNANRKRQLAVETAAKEGLRASVPLYIAAAEAFAQEDRPAQSVELLAELLRAKEKRRGFLGRVEKNPLGPERARVASKYAELARSTSPTEDTLEMLSDLSVEFEDSTGIRRANADGLRNAGYAADAIEEYRYCWKLEPEDGDIPVRLSELYAALGRTDEAIEHLRKGVALHAARGEFEQVADRAMRFIDLNPDGLDDVFASLELIPGEVLRKHVPSLDHLGVLVRRGDREAETRTTMERRLVNLYMRVLEVDGRNAAARRGINVLGPQYLADVEGKLRSASRGAAPPPPAPAQPEPAAAATTRPAIAQPQVIQTVTAPPAGLVEVPQPELVEAAPGELLAEGTPEAEAQASAPAVEAPSRAASAAPASATPPVAAEQAPAQAWRPGAPKPEAAPKPEPKPQPAAKPEQAPAAAPPVKPAAPATPTPAPAAVSPSQPAQPAAPAAQPAAAQPAATQPAAQAAAKPPAAQPAAAQPAAQPAAAQPAAEPAAAAPAASTPAPAPQPVPATATPIAAAVPTSAPSKGLYTFALRKAQEQFDGGHYDEAAAACERILKRGDFAEVLSLLARSYMKAEHKAEAVAACLRFADAEMAENPAKALEAFTELIKPLPDPALILRRSQLLTSARQIEFVGKDR